MRIFSSVRLLFFISLLFLVFALSGVRALALYDASLQTFSARCTGDFIHDFAAAQACATLAQQQGTTLGFTISCQVIGPNNPVSGIWYDPSCVIDGLRGFAAYLLVGYDNPAAYTSRINPGWPYVADEIRTRKAFEATLYNPALAGTGSGTATATRTGTGTGAGTAAGAGDRTNQAPGGPGATLGPDDLAAASRALTIPPGATLGPGDTTVIQQRMVNALTTVVAALRARLAEITTGRSAAGGDARAGAGASAGGRGESSFGGNTFAGGTAGSSGEREAAHFSLSASPAQRNVGRSGSVTFSVSVFGNDSEKTVSFSVAGLPAGVTGFFTPETVRGNGATTLTLNVDASAASGLRRISVYGISEGASSRAAISLVVGATANLDRTGPLETAPAGSTLFSPSNTIERRGAAARTFSGPLRSASSAREPARPATPVQTGNTFGAVTTSTPGAPPEVSLKVNGKKDITVSMGDVLLFEWDSRSVDDFEVSETSVIDSALRTGYIDFSENVNVCLAASPYLHIYVNPFRKYTGAVSGSVSSTGGGFVGGPWAWTGAVPARGMEFRVPGNTECSSERVHTITLKGTQKSSSRTAQDAVTVHFKGWGSPDFSLSPMVLQIKNNQTGQYGVVPAVATAGQSFSGEVYGTAQRQLGVNGAFDYTWPGKIEFANLPAGFSGTFGPITGQPDWINLTSNLLSKNQSGGFGFKSTMTLSVGSGVAPGIYFIKIVGTDRIKQQNEAEFPVKVE